MGTTKGVDFEDFSDDDFEGDDFAFVEDAADRRRTQKARKSPRVSWRSVEDYLENKRLKGQVSDVFDDE